MRWLGVLFVLAGCATTGETPASSADPEAAAVERVTKALAALPACSAGADVGRLVPKATMCTRMFCRTACCNQCSWSASYETMSGAREASVADVQRLLGVPESALDCEIAAWRNALSAQSVVLDAPACVVR